MNSVSRHLFLIALVFVTVSGCGRCLAGEVENDPFLDQAPGYFPTYQESGILMSGDYDYLRGFGGPLSGPDLDRWGATGGVWPYEYQTSGLSRLQRWLQPVDYILRPLTPGETLAIQGPTSNSWFQLGGSFPFLTRTYHVERSTFADMFGMEATEGPADGFGRSMIENSPVFFDILAVTAHALYVEGSGPGFEHLDEGFFSALSFDLRAGWGLTDRTSLIVNGQLYFVFTEDADFQVYMDAGALSAFASLNFQRELGPWDIRIYDDLIPFSSRRLFFDETYKGEIQQAGHYFVGIPDSVEPTDWWDSRQHYLLNTAGITAGTFLSESLRFMAGFGRVDTWVWNDWDRHSGYEYTSAGLFYDGYDLWIAPSLTYTLQTEDFDNAQSILMLNGVAPISPNITVSGGVGWSWGEYYEGWNWNLALNYQQTDRLHHSLSYYSGYQDVLIGDDFLGSRLDYGINYQLGPRIQLGGYAGWFYGTDERPDAVHLGGSLTAALGNYSSLRFIVAYLDHDYERIAGDGTEWMYNVTFRRQFAERLYGELGYEFIDSGPGLYDESIVMFRLTRTF